MRSASRASFGARPRAPKPVSNTARATPTPGSRRAPCMSSHVAARRGDHARARAWLESGLALERELDDQQGIAWSLLALAEDAVRRRDAPAARRWLSESLTVAEQTGDRLMLARNLEGLASLLRTDWPQRAVRLAGADDAVRTSLGTTAHPTEGRQLRAVLSATAGPLARRRSRRPGPRARRCPLRRR